MNSHTICVNRFNRWRKAGVWGGADLLADRAYDSDKLRQSRNERGA
jgi:transposase